MSPRRSVADALRTRQRILERSLEIATLEGLEGLTIGRLAGELGMSKAGVLGHFGTKQSLQLAVVDAGAERFAEEVPERVRDVPAGLPRLRAICEAWVGHLEQDSPPGGCFFTAAATEFDGREGPVRDAILGMAELWQRDLRIQARTAVAAGELPPDTEVDELIQELVGTMLALNHFLQLHRDRRAPERARRSLRRLLGG